MPVYSSYSYNQGGYGDFIRSLFAVFVYCKMNNIKHEIYIPDHPLNNVIECIKDRKINYPIKRFIDNYKTNKPLLDELNKCKNKDYNIILHSNQFDFIPFDILSQYRIKFKNFVKYTPIMVNRISELKKQINNVEYTAIHIRCGDKFMESKSQCVNRYLINPNNEILYKNLENTINFLKNTYSLPICVFTDVKSLKEKIKKKYDVLCFDTEIHHVASENSNINAFIDPIAEFELLGNAKAIVKLSNSGYAYWTAFINDVPLFIYKNNSIVPYKELNYKNIFGDCIK